jgi:hypothetical protein
MTENCPHLENCYDAICCSIARAEIGHIDGSDMRLCMSRHYEVCHVYSNALRREIFARMAAPGANDVSVPAV